MPRSFRWQVGRPARPDPDPGSRARSGCRARDPHGPRGRYALGSRQALPRRSVPLARHLPDEHERRRGSALDLSRRGAPARRHRHACRPFRPTDTPEPPAGRRSPQADPPRRPRRATRPPQSAARPMIRPRVVAAADPRAAHRRLRRTSQGAEEQGLFGRKRAQHAARKASRPTPTSRTAPLRRSEFYSSGFLTENQKLPFGQVLGPVTPAADPRQQRQRQRAAVLDHRDRGAPRRHLPDRRHAARGAARPRRSSPTARWSCRPASSGWSTRCRAATSPTSSPSTAPIRNGQRVLPVEKFTPSGECPRGAGDRRRAGHVHRRPRPPGSQGAPDGRVPRTRAARTASRRATCSRSGAGPSGSPDGRQLINEVMATMQVVHVRDHTATARLLNILSPDIPPGTDARQVAKLPS